MLGDSGKAVLAPTTVEPVAAPVPRTIIVAAEAQHTAEAIRSAKDVTKEIYVSNALLRVQLLKLALGFVLTLLVILPEAHELDGAVERTIQLAEADELLFARD